MLKNLSIYIHYPFCKSKCPYCDFNSHIAKKIDYEEYIISYEKELDFFVNGLQEDIAKMDIGDIIMLPGGYVTTDGGHFMLYEIKKVEKNK